MGTFSTIYWDITGAILGHNGICDQHSPSIYLLFGCEKRRLRLQLMATFMGIFGWSGSRLRVVSESSYVGIVNDPRISMYITKGSVSYLSSPCFSTSLGGIGGPARGIHGILAVMYWISILRAGPPRKMVMGSIPTGDAVTGPHIRGTLSMREMSL